MDYSCLNTTDFPNKVAVGMPNIYMGENDWIGNYDLHIPRKATTTKKILYFHPHMLKLTPKTICKPIKEVPSGMGIKALSDDEIMMTGYPKEDDGVSW